MTVTFEGSAAEVLSEMQVFLKNSVTPKGSTVEVTPEKVTLACTAAPQISKVKIPDSAPKAAKAAKAAKSPAVPVAPAKEYTQAEILAACGPLMDAGKVPELTQIIQEFGVASMMEIPQEKYGELAVKLRAMGAKL